MLKLSEEVCVLRNGQTLRYSWIKRSLIKEKYEITDLEIRDAFQTAENEYTYTSDYRP